MGRFSGVFLLIEPDMAAAEAMASAIHEFGRAHVVSKVVDADAWLSATGTATGMVVNLATGGSEAVSWLKEVHARAGTTPLLCLVEDASYTNELAPLRCEQLRLPCSSRELRGFARRALAFGRVRAARLSWFVEYAGRRAALSTGSTELLVQAVAAAPPGQVAADLGTVHSTLETQIRRLVSESSEDALANRADALLLQLLHDHPDRQYGMRFLEQRGEIAGRQDDPEPRSIADLVIPEHWKRTLRH